MDNVTGPTCPPDPAELKNRSVFRQIVCFLIVLIVCGATLLGWGTYRVAIFLAELPDRIQINVDDQVVQQFFHEATILSVREGPKPQRIEVIRYLADAGPDAYPYLDEVIRATSDPDPEIAAAAEAAVEAICSQTAARPEDIPAE